MKDLLNICGGTAAGLGLLGLIYLGLVTTSGAGASGGDFLMAAGGLICGLILLGMAQIVGGGSPAKPDEPQKKCPDCAETILAAAHKCRYCGYQFDGLDVGQD